MNDEENYETGKAVEEYFNPEAAAKELENLNIPDEPNPETTQTMEMVAEPPVRNKPADKPVKQESPKKPVAPKIAVAETPPPVVKEPVVEVQPPIQEAPQEEALPEPVDEQRQLFKGIDDYIERQSAAIENQYATAGEALRERYVAEGKLASKQFRDGSYSNLFAVMSGQARVVPIEEEQPEPVVEAMPEKVVVDKLSVSEELRSIDASLNDPLIDAGFKRALMKRKFALLNVQIDDVSLVEPAPSVQAAPVIVDKEPVPAAKPKKEKKPMSMKQQLSLIGAIGAAVVLGVLAIISILAH